jgi:HK97 family phage major capsid protein
VDRQGITVQRDPYTKKPFVEFYTRRRVGGDVVNFQAIKLLYIGTPTLGA